MKTTLLLLALGTAALSMAPIGNADASDYKMYHGSGCKVFGATAWTDLHFAAAGIHNLTNTPKNIICPLVKDTEAAWDGDAGVPTNTALVHLHWRAGPVQSNISCNVYVSGSDGTLIETTSYSSGTVAAGTEGFTDISGLNSTGFSGTHAQPMMLCTLGPRAWLMYYYLYEQGASD